MTLLTTTKSSAMCTRRCFQSVAAAMGKRRGCGEGSGGEGRGFGEGGERRREEGKEEGNKGWR